VKLRPTTNNTRLAMRVPMQSRLCIVHECKMLHDDEEPHAWYTGFVCTYNVVRVHVDVSQVPDLHRGGCVAGCRAHHNPTHRCSTEQPQHDRASESMQCAPTFFLTKPDKIDKNHLETTFILRVVTTSAFVVGCGRQTLLGWCGSVPSV
jgi:hypothetical protein